jgi:hypothetical protein
MSQLIFRCDDQMWPSKINAAWAGSQFVARARIAATAEATESEFLPFIGDEIWGILIELPNQADGEIGSSVSATTDDGRIFTASVSYPVMSGNPEDLLSVARYWELPPVFVGGLKAHLESTGKVIDEEEPRDDGNLQAEAVDAG